jgi:hypothetical protein
MKSQQIIFGRLHHQEELNVNVKVVLAVVLQAQYLG